MNDPAMTLYGIRNCDTVKRARARLDAAGEPYRFHDYKLSGVDPVLLSKWVANFGWEALLNRSGTTFRKLPEADRADLTDERALALMVAHPSSIRRPIVTCGDTVTIGFKPAEWDAAGL